MKRSPCASCNDNDANYEKDLCKYCAKRYFYVATIGDSRYSLPVEASSLCDERLYKVTQSIETPERPPDGHSSWPMAQVKERRNTQKRKYRNTVTMIPGYKICPAPGCRHRGSPIPATTEHFYASKSRPGGLSGWCRDCLIKRAAQNKKRLQKKLEEQKNQN
jgi:hypothetical protein